MLGISTRGTYGEGTATTGEHRRYSSVPYDAIFRILDSLMLTCQDVVVDLGSGKGRLVCCAATYRIERVIGVEDVEYVHRIAEHNIARMRRKRAPALLILGKAQDFDFAVGTVFYLFNPFGPETIKEVLRKLHEGVRAKPRAVRIVYVHPLHNEVLMECGWLAHIETRRFDGLRWSVSVWRSVQEGSISAPIQSLA